MHVHHSPSATQISKGARRLRGIISVNKFQQLDLSLFTSQTEHLEIMIDGDSF